MIARESGSKIGIVSSNRVDYQHVDEGNVTHYVNVAKAGTEDEQWLTLKELYDLNIDFLDMVFIKLTGKHPSYKKRKLLLKTLFLMSTGTGYHAPSVFLARMIASTTKQEEFAIVNGLISGISSVGTHHLGAVVKAMRMLHDARLRIEEGGDDISEYCKKYVFDKLAQGNKIAGFGHPVYKKDPRPDMLFKDVKALFGSDIYVQIYEELSRVVKQQKNIYPNIDLVLGVSYLCLGFESGHGMYLSILGRTLNMISHIFDELPKKPFSFLNEAVPLEYKDLVGKGHATIFENSVSKEVMTHEAL